MKLMVLTFVLVSSFLSGKNSWAQEEAAVINMPTTGKGCLVNLNKKSLGLDPQCRCIKLNNCFRFPAAKTSHALVGLTDKNGNAVHTQKFKSQLTESTNVFNQIMALKARGINSGSEIKELYKKLDSLNRDVRKDLLTRHASYFTKAKNQYRNDLKKENARQEKMRLQISEFVKKPQSVANVRNSTSPSKPALSNAQNPIPVKDSAMPATATVSNAEEVIKQNKLEELSKNLNQMNLDVNEDDSIFDIITKRYIRTYPKLIED